jgi:hypothetical protein
MICRRPVSGPGAGPAPAMGGSGMNQGMEAEGMAVGLLRYAYT